MSDAIITVSNLGKKYRIKHQAEGRRYTALRDVIAEKAKSFFKMLKSEKTEKANAEMLKTEKLKSGNDFSVSAFQHSSVSSSEDFWALKDVSFEVKRGEVVGIIGRNGAGKSTLLKILSRITEPTEGRVTLRGRVASLLEVGTGFHPELTGRENVFLNGAILGMSRAEIRKKFDEIVAFAEVEKFLDTPVKRYSSGMYVRLAFAVAAHLEPEILIVDEVLAVGDAEFQKKCLGKMKDVAGHGRTVLFVSHNMAAVNALCKRVAWLQGGKLKMTGSTHEIVSRYLTEDNQELTTGERDLRGVIQRKGDQQLRFTAIRTKNQYGQVTPHFNIFCPFSIELDFEVTRPLAGEIGFIIFSHDQTPLIRSSTDDSGTQLEFQAGLHTISCDINPNQLRPGRYSLLVGSTCGILRDLIEEALAFEIMETQNISQGSMHGMPGHLHFNFAWEYNNKTIQNS